MKKTDSYSKKVMKYFKHPRNYGKIKDADGIGKVGNPVCLTPGQNIHVNSDLELINEISPIRKVFSHNGLYNKVDKLVERGYNGNLLILKNKLGKVRLTPDHLILAIKTPRGDKFLRTKNRKKLYPAWYHAQDLKRGDIALYPILKPKEDLKYLSINIPKSKWDFRSKDIPDKIPLASDLLKLFGYFLSEGNIQNRPSETYISFTLNIKEKDIVDDIKKISQKIFGLEAIIKERPTHNTIVVYLYNAKLARFFEQLFGNGAGNKCLPGFIMNLPSQKQKHLIYGLWKGDGYVNLHRDGPRGGYVTISFKLAHQIKALLLRQGIIPSIYQEKEKIIKGVKHRKSYRIHIGQRDSLAKLCSILNLKYKPKSYSSEKAWVDKNYSYIPITEIKNENYKGKVYNLEVSGSHSFVSEAFCLHNCGDVMWLYIKVGKNKKGEEILKDIKFETFGCVAAIATSSVITELAEGKKLSEAMKITREEIVDSLEGLPPIKIHCSVLAASALSEAIYDYLSKNGRKVPKDLEEKHRILKKEREEVKEKHKEWVELEEKIHKG